MRVTITGDTASESGLGEIIDFLSGPTFKNYQSKHFGNDLLGLCIVLMCQNPALNLKRRIRLSKRDSILYMDIMFHLPTMVGLTPNERFHNVIRYMQKEVPEVLGRYKKLNFEREAFVSDFNFWLDEMTKNWAKK